jgi:hypothetical protein
MEKEKELLDYLEKLRVDPDISEETITASVKLWNKLKEVKPGVTVPTAWADVVDNIMFWWTRRDDSGEVLVYLEAEIFPTGVVEWFCTDRAHGGESWFHDALDPQEIPEGVIELLRLF